MPIGVVLGVCSAVLTALVTEIYCHRCLAHRAFRVHPGRQSQAAGTGTSSGKWIFVLCGLVVSLYVVLFGPEQVLLMLVVHLVCYLGIMGMVNTVGHLYGRKPHPDVPGYDLAWLAIPLLGHGYHNSHHAHPAASRTGPLDPVWPLLRLLDAVRLVELGDRRAQPHPQACCNASRSVSSPLQEASFRRF